MQVGKQAKANPLPPRQKKSHVGALLYIFFHSPHALGLGLAIYHLSTLQADLVVFLLQNTVGYAARKADLVPSVRMG
jgi:hypothetical protein